MSKSNLVSPLEVQCLPAQIGEVLCGQAAVQQEGTIRRIEIPYSLLCHSLSSLYLHLRYYHALYKLTHLRT